MKRSGFVLAQLNWPLIAAVSLITLLGVYNIHSSAASEAPTLYLDQLVFFIIGAVAIVLLLVPDYRVSESLAYPFYAIMCLLLVAVVAKGVSAGGARRWLLLGPVRFQPSEFAKLAAILAMARYLSLRLRPGGYTLGSLLRPLNPSRPLVVIVGIAMGWGKPWLVDAPGELARLVRKKTGGVPLEIADLLWFRVLLIGLIVLGGLLGVWMVLRIARSQALLNPWPPERRNRAIAATAGFFLALLALLLWNWSHPFVRDPFGFAMSALNTAAAPGGRYAELQPGYGLRISLVVGAGIYVLASLSSMRRGAQSAIDVLVAPIDILLVPAALIAAQPDLDNAVILVLTGLSTVIVVGVRLRSIIILAVMGAMLAGVSWFGVLKDYQKRRILTFIDPQQDVQGAGWNAVQSMIAVGSGQLWGKGHRGGTQTQLSFLPEQHTDFAFSVWAEEQGFAGCMLLLFLYGAMLLTAFGIAAEAREPYGALIATGIGASLFWETFINIGMVIGILPVVGMTLPFFSYGGSSLIAKLIAAGILLNVHLRRRVV